MCVLDEGNANEFLVWHMLCVSYCRKKRDIVWHKMLLLKRYLLSLNIRRKSWKIKCFTVKSLNSTTINAKSLYRRSHFNFFKKCSISIKSTGIFLCASMNARACVWNVVLHVFYGKRIMSINGNLCKFKCDQLIATQNII